MQPGGGYSLLWRTFPQVFILKKSLEDQIYTLYAIIFQCWGAILLACICFGAASALTIPMGLVSCLDCLGLLGGKSNWWLTKSHWFLDSISYHTILKKLIIMAIRNQSILSTPIFQNVSEGTVNQSRKHYTIYTSCARWLSARRKYLRTYSLESQAKGAKNVCEYYYFWRVSTFGFNLQPKKQTILNKHRKEGQNQHHSKKF